MPPRQKETITVDVSQPVQDGTGGARRQGNVLVCDFELTKDAANLRWKPYNDIGKEIAVLGGGEDRLLVFVRPRIINDPA